MIPTISIQQVIFAVYDETGMSLAEMKLVANAKTQDCKISRMHLIYTMRYVLGNFAGSNALAALLNERSSAKIRQLYQLSQSMFYHDHRFRASQMRIFHSLGLSFKWEGMTLEVWKD